MDIFYSPKFARQYKKLPPSIQRLAEKKESIFRKNPFDSKLAAHKLHGELADFWSFSIKGINRGAELRISGARFARAFSAAELRGIKPYSLTSLPPEEDRRTEKMKMLKRIFILPLARQNKPPLQNHF